MLVPRGRWRYAGSTPLSEQSDQPRRPRVTNREDKTRDPGDRANKQAARRAETSLHRARLTCPPRPCPRGPGSTWCRGHGAAPVLPAAPQAGGRAQHRPRRQQAAVTAVGAAPQGVRGRGRTPPFPTPARETHRKLRSAVQGQPACQRPPLRERAGPVTGEPVIFPPRLQTRPPGPPRNHRVLRKESQLGTIESRGGSGPRWRLRPPAAVIGWCGLEEAGKRLRLRHLHV